MLVLVDHVDDGVAGAERFAVGTARALPSDRFRVTVCTTRHATGELRRQLDEAGIPCLALGRRGRLDLLPFARLTRYLRDERVDVLHAHKFGSNVWGTLLGRLSRVPVVVAHEHTWSYEGQPLRRWLDGRLIGRLATRFVAVSEADRGRMVALEKVPPNKAIVIPTAFIPRPARNGGDLRLELGIDPQARVVGTVALLRPQKALDVLIDAFRLVCRALPESRLVIVGDGPDRPRLEAAAAGVDGVTFAGARSDLDTVLGAFDVAAMSSDFEGLPLFVFECMAHRVPLVATAVGGIPEVVVDGETGRLVPPREAAALAEALVDLLGDAGERQRLADAAAERLGDYTLERAAERLAALYDDLLSAGGG